jgi:DNA protecting protein DprA
MYETKNILSTLVWRGIRFSPKTFNQLCNKLPVNATEAEILEALSSEYRLKLAFEKDWYDRGRSELDWLARFGARLVTLADDDYPEGLRDFRDAPPALTVKGASVWQNLQGISIVGSRHASQASLLWLDHELDAFLERRNIFVASGGARGIDQKSHAVTMRKKKPTVVFVPAGLGAMYPRNLSDWIAPVIESGGAFVSTYAPSCVMEKNLFVERNRYIAAISHSTLIIEAKRRSGTMVTARWATALNRPIGVVPCSPTAAGLGGLDILADDGVLIRDYKDLLILTEMAGVKSLRLFGENEYRGQGSI